MLAGTADDIQEYEDWGELESLLRGKVASRNDLVSMAVKQQTSSQSNHPNCAVEVSEDNGQITSFAEGANEI
jgi:hypothetical protein